MLQLKKRFSFKLLFTAVLIVTFLTHVSYIPNGFTWLDHGDIERKRTVIPLDKLPSAFISRFGDTGFYRPLVTFTNSIDAALYGNFAPGFHFTNVLLHTAVTATVPLFLLAFFPLSMFEILLVTLFFGVHPISFLPVGAISYRQELLFSLFVFLSVHFHARARQTTSKRYQLFTLLTIFFALLSKETTLILVPFFIFVWEFKNSIQQTKNKKLKNHVPKHYLPKKFLLAELTPFVIYVFLRLTAVPEIWRLSHISSSLYESVTLRLSLFGKMLINIISPLTPPLSDAVSFASLTHPIVLVAIIVILTSLFVIKKLGVNHTVSIAFFLLFLSFSPGLNIIPIPRIGSPHYAYIAIPLVGFLLICLFHWVTQNKPITRYISIVCITAWFILAAQSTFFSGFNFKNDYTLFRPEVARDPQFLEGYFYLGNYYLSQRAYSLAEQLFKQSLEPQDKYHAYREPVSNLTNLAAAYYAQEKYKEADEALKEAQSMAASDEQSSILYNRALLASEQKDYQKVVILLENNYGTNPFAMLLLADALHKLNRTNDAKTVLEKSLPYWPKEQKQRVEALIRSIQNE